MLVVGVGWDGGFYVMTQSHVCIFLRGHLHMYASAVKPAFVSCKLAFFLVPLDVGPDQHLFADILELEEYTGLGEYYSANL